MPFDHGPVTERKRPLDHIDRGAWTYTLSCRLSGLTKAEEVGESAAKLQGLGGRLFLRRSRSRSGVSTFRHRSRCGGGSFRSVAGRIRGRASWLAATIRTTLGTTASPASGLAVVNDFVTAGFQGFFGFVANAPVAVSQSHGQSFDDFVSHAAAAVLANLVADFVSSFVTNPLIAIVQSVGEGGHDLGVAAAVVTIAKTIDRFRTIFGVAGSL